MKKLLIPILLFVFASCQKQDRLVYLATTQDAFTVNVFADTVISGCWDGAGKVLRIEDKRITGTGCLKNWIIDAPETQFVIDTGITLINCKPYNGVFSATWLGALPANADNSFHIQKAINTCIGNGIRNLKIPNGTYNFSNPLQIINGNYQASLHIFGDASFWDTGGGTTLNYTGKTGCAFNLQLNKGTEFDHIRLTGQWKPPGGSDMVYFNLSEADYKDASGYNIDDYYTGFAIDNNQNANGSQSGSTGNYIHDITVSGFAKLIAMSQNGVTANNDIEIFERIQFGNGKYGFVSGQAQEKGNIVRGLYSWGSIYNLISIGKSGKYQAGNYSFEGANVAGKCINIFDVKQDAWFSSHATGFFCESIKTIGNIQTSIPFTIEKSSFNLKFISQVGQRIVFTTNSAKVKVRDCTIRFYNGHYDELWVHGYPSNFENIDIYLDEIIYK